jgi:lipopolysaccharide transport system permease protein
VRDNAVTTSQGQGLALAGELLRIKELLVCLAWRDLRVRYKQSLLGVAWAVVQPLSLMLVFTLVLGPALGANLLDNLPYALFVLAGLVPWTYFSSGLSQCVNSLVANRNLITKVSFPREALPFSCVATSLVDCCIGLAALGGLIAYYHVKGTWSYTFHATMFFLPAIVLVHTLLIAGLGMIVAMGNLFYRDVRPMLGVALQLGMFVSAVVVPPPTGTTWAARIVAMNPLVPIVGGYRDCLLFGRLPDPAAFCYAAMFSVFALLAGWALFRRASVRFAECV